MSLSDNNITLASLKKKIIWEKVYCSCCLFGAFSLGHFLKLFTPLVIKHLSVVKKDQKLYINLIEINVYPLLPILILLFATYEETIK